MITAGGTFAPIRGVGNGRFRRILIVAARSGEGPFTNRFADLGPRSPAILEAGSESDRREPVISRFMGCQLGDLPNMIQPPLLGVVNAASTVSAQTVTWRAPAVPRSCSMLSVYIAVRQRPVPRLPPLEHSGCGPSTLMSPA